MVSSHCIRSEANCQEKKAIYSPYQLQNLQTSTVARTARYTPRVQQWHLCGGQNQHPSKCIEGLLNKKE